MCNKKNLKDVHLESLVRSLFQELKVKVYFICKMSISIFRIESMVGRSKGTTIWRISIPIFLIEMCGRLGAAVWAPTIGRRRLGAGHLGAWTIRYKVFFQLRFSVATLFQFVARFARVRIEDSNRNSFALNGIQGIACFIHHKFNRLSANLLKLESSILPRAKRATNRNNVATEQRN